MFDHLQKREIFHLTFLRQFARRIKTNKYALKGGSNIRFFYNSPRYSEDMDLDIDGIEIFMLKEIVMEILESKTLVTTLRPFQIDNIVPPNIGKAKQTETVQRFKVHLLTSAGEDLFTKIEFSRRGLEMGYRFDSVNEVILRAYKQPPLIIPHYPADLVIAQKIRAMADRIKPQPRDVFDIFILHSQLESAELDKVKNSLSKDVLKAAEEMLFALDYKIYSDTVGNYLSNQDRDYFDKPEVWEKIQLNVGEIIRV